MTVDSLIAAVGRPVQTVTGNRSLLVKSIGSIDESSSGSITFCRFVGNDAERLIAASAASVLVVCEPQPEVDGRCFIVVQKPKAWFTAALHVLLPSVKSAGIDPSATVMPGAVVGQEVSIGPHAFIGADVHVGNGCIISANAVLLDGTRLGRNCVVGPNATIGFHGLALSREADDSLSSFPHIGGVSVGDNVEIGPNCVVARGVLKDTCIGNGVKIGNLVNIGHNCSIGDDTWISSGAMVCGSVKLGKCVQLGASSIIKNQMSVPDGVHVGLGTVVMKKSKQGDLLFGFPAKPFPKLFRFD